MKENRIFERFPARFPAKFRNSFNDFGTNVFLRNASASGVKITTQEKLFQNDSVSLLVKLPDGHDPLVLNCQVIWSKNRDPNLWDVGLKLYKINFMQIQRLFKLVEGSSL